MDIIQVHNDISIGVVTDWLVTYAGSEKVVADLLWLYPEASLYAVVDYLSSEDRVKFNGKVAETTFIQKLPKSKIKYQKYLPLMPLAIEQVDVSKHDIVISSSHAVSKGVLTGPDQLHISYVHSPIRYAWDLQHQYLRQVQLDKGIKSILARYILHKIRLWDYRTAHGVDHFIANSNFIARRINKVYGRHADVIYPPVDVESFKYKESKSDFYLTASRLVPYKRMDLIVEAFSHMPDKKLVVIGDGPEMARIKSKATKNIDILGYQSNTSMLKYMQNARAFVFAAEEDFGITPVEAQACGTPVIAFGKGGALETVRPFGVDNPTGVFFKEQTTQSLVEAVHFFDKISDKISPISCRLNAEKFSTSRFRSQIEAYVKDKYDDFKERKKIIY